LKQKQILNHEKQQRSTCYKLVAVIKGRYVSIFDGQTQYVMGKIHHQPISHGKKGGFFVHRSMDGARAAMFPKSSNLIEAAKGKRTAVLECDTWGERVELDAHGKMLVANFTPIREHLSDEEQQVRKIVEQKKKKAMLHQMKQQQQQRQQQRRKEAEEATEAEAATDEEEQQGAAVARTLTKLAQAMKKSKIHMRMVDLLNTLDAEGGHTGLVQAKQLRRGLRRALGDGVEQEVIAALADAFVDPLGAEAVGADGELGGEVDLEEWRGWVREYQRRLGDSARKHGPGVGADNPEKRGFGASSLRFTASGASGSTRGTPQSFDRFNSTRQAAQAAQQAVKTGPPKKKQSAWVEETWADDEEGEVPVAESPSSPRNKSKGAGKGSTGKGRSSAGMHSSKSAGAMRTAIEPAKHKPTARRGSVVGEKMGNKIAPKVIRGHTLQEARRRSIIQLEKGIDPEEVWQHELRLSPDTRKAKAAATERVRRASTELSIEGGRDLSVELAMATAGTASSTPSRRLRQPTPANKPTPGYMKKTAGGARKRGSFLHVRTDWEEPEEGTEFASLSQWFTHEQSLRPTSPLKGQKRLISSRVAKHKSDLTKGDALVAGKRRPPVRSHTQFSRGGSTTVIYEDAKMGKLHAQLREEKIKKEMIRRRRLRQTVVTELLPLLPKMEMMWKRLQLAALNGMHGWEQELAMSKGLEEYEVERRQEEEEADARQYYTPPEGEEEDAALHPKLPELRLNRQRFMNAMQYFEKLRTSHETKAINRLFSSFDLKIEDSINIVELCIYCRDMAVLRPPGGRKNMNFFGR
jgi:hypothetical protein